MMRSRSRLMKSSPPESVLKEKWEDTDMVVYKEHLRAGLTAAREEYAPYPLWAIGMPEATASHRLVETEYHYVLNGRRIIVKAWPR